MALPPLELFSLRKKPPYFRRLFPFFIEVKVRQTDERASLPSAAFCTDALRLQPATVKSPLEFADVAQLVEQLIRNQ
jgi:hypothetical protein